MRSTLLILLGLLLPATHIHAQSFATGLGAGVRISRYDGINLSLRYGASEILGGIKIPGVLGFDAPERSTFIGGQRRISLWTRERFRVYSFGRLVVGFAAEDAETDESFSINLLSAVGGAGVEFPLRRSVRSEGFVISLDLASGLFQDTWRDWFPQLGIGLHYYFF